MSVKKNNWNNRLELGEYLCATRKERKLSQKVMADILGCSAQYLTLLERGGVSEPGVQMLRAIAEKYQLDFEMLTNVYYPSKSRGRNSKNDVMTT